VESQSVSAADSSASHSALQDKTYVLIHGAFRGAWCWKHVAARLRGLGYTVHTPTLTGLGERSHLLSLRPTLATFIEDTAQVIRYEDLYDVILVAHSFSGSVASAIADRMPERLRHLVYLDALLLQSGESAADMAGDSMTHYKQRALATSNGLSVPPGRPEQSGITDPRMAAWMRTKLTPHSLQTYYDKLELKHPLCNGVPATYIACSRPLYANTASSRDLARTTQGWTYQEIPTGHDAMLLLPDELTQMLAAIG
jgi:pimeloyl-ACP methyl ester carboxylesterase